MAQADGEEVLILDGDAKVRKGLENLLATAGLTPTSIEDAERAVELTREKFFSVALIDLDTPTEGRGVELIGRINASSPPTVVIVMSSRQSYEGAVKAFRAGATDVIFKSPEQVPYLKERVVRAAASQRRVSDGNALLKDALAFHEELIRLTIETYRKAGELEEKSHVDYLPIDEDMSVLVVESSGWLYAALGALVQAKGGGYAVHGVRSGGEALDEVGRRQYQMLLVAEALPDLPGSMVVRTIKAQAPDTIALLFTPPDDDTAGAVTIHDGQRAQPFLPQFSDPAQILERLDELRENYNLTARERRYVAAFRQEHYDLLKKYAELRQRLQRTVERE